MRRLAATLFLGVIAWVALSPIATPRAQASDFWDEAKHPGLRAWRRRIEHAKELLTAPASSDWREQTDLALGEATVAVQVMPNLGEGLIVRAVALGRLARVREAAEDIRQALEREPPALERSRYAGELVILVIQLGDTPLAVQMLERVLAVMRASAERAYLYGLYGTALQSLGPTRIEEAILAYREALRGSPSPEARNALGLWLALRRANQATTELESLRGAIEAIRPEEITREQLPESEVKARTALLLDLKGDLSGARNNWSTVTGVWRDHALVEINRLRPLRRRP